MIAPQNHNDHVFMVDVRTEIEWARERYSNVSSLHEGYSVILEELDEFWEEVKKKPQARTASAMHKELVQVAAMAMRTASDVVARYER
jgi:hypothetical protein